MAQPNVHSLELPCTRLSLSPLSRIGGGAGPDGSQQDACQHARSGLIGLEAPTAGIGLRVRISSPPPGGLLRWPLVRGVRVGSEHDTSLINTGGVRGFL